MVVGQHELLQISREHQKLDRGPTVESHYPADIRSESSLNTSTTTAAAAATRFEQAGQRRSESRESIKRSSEALLRRLADAEAAAHANVHSSAAAMRLTFSTIQQHQQLLGQSAGEPVSDACK